jgi:hypothetical protein
MLRKDVMASPLLQSAFQEPGSRTQSDDPLYSLDDPPSLSHSLSLSLSLSLSRYSSV